MCSLTLEEKHYCKDTNQIVEGRGSLYILIGLFKLHSGEWIAGEAEELLRILKLAIGRSQ